MYDTNQNKANVNEAIDIVLEELNIALKKIDQNKNQDEIEILTKEQKKITRQINLLEAQMYANLAEITAKNNKINSLNNQIDAIKQN